MGKRRWVAQVSILPTNRRPHGMPIAAVQSCFWSRHKVNVAEVGRADMLAFKTWLKRQKCSGRSPYNHFLNIAIFFVWAKGEEDRWVLTTMIGRRDLSVIQRRIPKRRLRNYWRQRQDRFGDCSALTTRRNMIDCYCGLLLRAARWRIVYLTRREALGMEGTQGRSQFEDEGLQARRASR